MLAIDPMEEVKRRALEITAEIEAKCGPYRSEIVPHETPLWHLIKTAPNEEMKAADYLADRQFGVFVPKFAPDVKMKVNGHDLCGARRLMFPGHVLVFVWDITAHWRRLRACPGVINVLCDRPEHPVIVADKDVSFIYSLQFGWKNRKRKRYASSKPRPKADIAMQGLVDKQPEVRNAALYTLLGVSPSIGLTESVC